ncbi:hypothetical protein CV632_12335 [Geobacillus thermodenitrificans]|jgi:hypothetical protein|uniref:Uncharacterized protein n=1 Tax=Geobacillus thermodenitrificans (strain NG80-2) TaxID=420246 RepID=A4ITA2_GEOTN|nr:hypothetical protein GTNG_3211 [Geobacillus thermodenitrificans NG80-2]MEC5188039.1 hypothetical protein [Geobacillus thermodenitrificans]PJW20212.1 hypothetical protein CV632_12335 [Geobacillus thermodenitrificans]
MLLDGRLIVVHFFYQVSEVSDGYLRRKIELSSRRNTVSTCRLEAVVLSVEVRNVYIGLLVLAQCAERFEQHVFGMVPRSRPPSSQLLPLAGSVVICYHD